MSIISLPINSTSLFFKLSGGCESGGVTEKGAVVSRNSVAGVYRKSTAACTVHPSIGGFTRQSNQVLVTATNSQQMTEVISSTSSFDQFNWRQRMLHFCRRKPSAEVSQATVSLLLFQRTEMRFFVIPLIIIIIVWGKILERFCIFQLTSCASIEWRKNNNFFT